MYKYRVDRNNCLQIPCGMNSIVHMSNNFNRAYAVFNDTLIGYNWWSKIDSSYGVILSQWDSNENQYKIIDSKGLSN